MRAHRYIPICLRAMVMRSEDCDAVLGHTQIRDQVLTIVSDDGYRLEIIFLDEMHTRGKGPFKMVEGTYRRTESQQNGGSDGN